MSPAASLLSIIFACGDAVCGLVVGECRQLIPRLMGRLAHLAVVPAQRLDGRATRRWARAVPAFALSLHATTRHTRRGTSRCCPTLPSEPRHGGRKRRI